VTQWAIATADRSGLGSYDYATAGVLCRVSGAWQLRTPTPDPRHPAPAVPPAGGLTVSAPADELRRLRGTTAPAVRAVPARPAHRRGRRERRRPGRCVHRRRRGSPGQAVPAATGRQLRRIDPGATLGGRQGVRRLGG